MIIFIRCILLLGTFCLMIFLEMLVDVNNRDIAGTQIPNADC